MQFKHPELLWALLLLLIPIIIHLFQLRRFKKTPFTNVAMLQKVVVESRKSSSIKKWLLLLTRLFLMACLVISFAQPFLAKENALKEKETVIYLDNSFSMQSKKEGLSLLEKSIQDVLKFIPEETEFTLFTNDKTFKSTTLKAIQNPLLSLEYTSKQLSLDEIFFKAKKFFKTDNSSVQNLIVISDFQNRLGSLSDRLSERTNIHLVQLEANQQSNIAIDSIYLGKRLNNQVELHTVISGLQTDESIPISLFNDAQLIAKTAIVGENKVKNEVVFSIPEKEKIKGKILINDNGLSYDNVFYFNIDEQKPIKVLSINQTESDYIEKIFGSKEFEFIGYNLNQLNYGAIEAQNLIILNGLEQIPDNLQTVLNSFKKEGGSLMIIPSTKSDMVSYNMLLSKLGAARLQEKISLEIPVSKINFDHPLFQNVFEKRVTNFDYPTVKSFFKTSKSGATIISFSNDQPFLQNFENTYIFTAPINIENSNFQASPLIVPTLYNIAAFSLKRSSLYLKMGVEHDIDIVTNLKKDNIITLHKDTKEFIPRQQSFANKIKLLFIDNPNEDGIYAVLNDSDTLQHLSFNYSRAESNLSYQDMSNLDITSFQNNISELFNELAEDNTITDYWKWFVIFALVFALLELLIQKLIA
ncbi:BatA domain-containing protein [Croceitalea vernalis]|uniref:BatA domain-containing protein n=1 Tax=Croceitalea vernalis TaxID=3075599 RepID=A0ABU3BGT5_9FLAO|nr:BatA domain-containing protein [Croceitalea sp. P007]MDT0621379.1 BatA domain-containing protein [Croceitalea sp. P007]